MVPLPREDYTRHGVVFAEGHEQTFPRGYRFHGYNELKDAITIPNSDVAIRGAFKQVDFVKGKVLTEVRFGKYAFMIYNVCAKMTIFHNLGYIDCGIEIVPVKAFAEEMSTGVSYFEQFLWDLKARGISNIDIPVLILGIDD